jgi:hypothetical protein
MAVPEDLVAAGNSIIQNVNIHGQNVRRRVPKHHININNV